MQNGLADTENIFNIPVDNSLRGILYSCIKQREMTMVQKYTIEAGRNIYRNGKPFIAIMRCGETLPTEADDAARAITVLLQKDADVEILYQALTPINYDKING